MTDRELMKMANRIEALAFEMKAPNAHTPQFVMLANEIRARARLAQPEQQHSEQWWKHEVSNAWAEGYEKGRASVKQPEQEPVAWADKYDIERDGHDFWVSRQQPAKNGVPLYTAPPQREWQGLTDEEVIKLGRLDKDSDYFGLWYDFAQAIEAKLKEKNT